MYYEEQVIDNKLYYRTTPNGKWELICYEKLLDRLVETQNKLGELKEEVDFLRKQVQSQTDIFLGRK